MYGSGHLVGGKYRLVDQVGEGGMATVWRATHTHLGHDVAVKFLNNPGTQLDGVVERFLDEARIVASVRHRNVVDILDFGVADDGRPYMVMEFLEGESLADRLEREPPLSISEIVQLVALCLGGLAAVHDKGIVHRDVKPDNVFLTYDADGFFPKILDFGISKNLDRTETGDRFARTRDGVLLGTPQYMSPEQARGLRDIDHRTDLYSMGVMLYEALTGRRPFDSENVGDVLMLVMAGVYTPLAQFRPDVPPELVAVVESAMAREREMRFQDARTMRAALLAAAGPYRPVAGSSPDVFVPSEIRSLEALTGSPSMVSRLPLAPTPSALAALPRTTPNAGVKPTDDADGVSTVSLKVATPRELEIATALAPTLVAQSGQFMPPPRTGSSGSTPRTPDATPALAAEVDLELLTAPVMSPLAPPIMPAAKYEPPSVPPPRESGGGGLVFLATLVLLVAGSLGYAEWKYPGRLGLLATAIKGAVDRTVSASPEQPEDLASADGGVVDAGSAETIAVRLKSLPDDATIVVDGRTFGPLEIAPLRVGEDRSVVVRIPKHSGPFDVHVTAPGFLPFDGRRWALTDVSFRVRLDPIPDAGVAEGTGASTITAEPPPEPTRASSRRRRPTTHRRRRPAPHH